MSDNDDIFGDMMAAEEAEEQQAAEEQKEKKKKSAKKKTERTKAKKKAKKVEKNVGSAQSEEKTITNIPDPISVVITGPKGVGKSLLAYAMSHGDARFAVLDFDGNTETTVTKNIKIEKHENFMIWNVKAMLDFSTMTKDSIPKDCYHLTKKINLIFSEIRDLEFRPHYIIFDGYQRGTWIAEQAMRHQHQATAFGGVKNRNAWKERNFILDKWYSSAMQLALDGLIVTVHEVPRQDEDDPENQQKEPKWSGALKEEAQVEVHAKRDRLDIMSDEVSFLVTVTSNKITSKTVANLDVTREPYLFFEWLINEEDQEPMF